MKEEAGGSEVGTYIRGHGSKGGRMGQSRREPGTVKKREVREAKDHLVKKGARASEVGNGRKERTWDKKETA